MLFRRTNLPELINDPPMELRSLDSEDVIDLDGMGDVPGRTKSVRVSPISIFKFY